MAEFARYLPGLVALEVSVPAGCGFGSTSPARYVQIAGAIKAIQGLPRSAPTACDASLAELDTDVKMLSSKVPAVSHAWTGEADELRKLCYQRAITFTAAETHRASLCVTLA